MQKHTHLHTISLVARKLQIIMMYFALLWFGYMMVIYFIPVCMYILDVPLYPWQQFMLRWSAKPVMVTMIILLCFGYIEWVIWLIKGKGLSQQTAEMVISLQQKQQAMEKEIAQLQAASCPFPWYTVQTTTEQRLTFEKELTQLCAACTKGSKGAVLPLVQWLLAQQDAGRILLPNNYTQIYTLLAEQYHLGVSKQAFSAAMPTKA